MQAKIDQNYRRSLLAVLDDGSFNTQPVLANPITKRLLVSAVVTSNNTGIGNTIPGGTPGSVLFLDIGSTLAEDNPNFFYDPATVSFGIGTNTPDATLNVNGTVHLDLGGDATGDIFYRDAGGFLAPLGIGTSGQILAVSGGLPSWVAATSLVSGYNTIQDGGAPITQRSTMNFVNYFNVTDVASVTTININTSELGADTTLISTLETNLDLANISGQINLATQVTGQLSATNIDITNLESTLDLGNIAGQIDLATQVTGLLDGANIDQGTLDLGNIGGSLDLSTQVTGTLGLANGGTGSSLSDPGYDAAYVWDNTTNTTRLANLSGLSYDSGSNTLTATSSSSTSTLSCEDDFLSIYPNSISTSHLPTNAFNIGEMGWGVDLDVTGSGFGGGVSSVTGIANHPGIFQLGSGNSAISFVKLGGTVAGATYPIPNIMQNNAVYTFIAKPEAGGVPGVSLSFVGLGKFLTDAMVDNAIRVEFNNGNIIFRTSDGGATESTTIGAYASQFYNFTLTISGASVALSVDGGAPTTHVTHIPVANTTASVYWGAFYNFGIQGDYFSMYYPGLTR